MEYAELLRKTGFDSRRAYSNPANVRAVVLATEMYVAEHDPVFQHELVELLENAFGRSGRPTDLPFSPPRFISSAVKRTWLLDVVKELYPDADRMAFPDKITPYGKRISYPQCPLFYLDRKKLLQYVMERTARKEVVVIEWHPGMPKR